MNTTEVVPTESRVESLREASIMAFYVAVVLDATLVAVDPEHSDSTVGLIWGTSIGLALAHIFAFQFAGRLTTNGKASSSWSVSVAQLCGAALVAALATVPVLLFEETVGNMVGAGVMEWFIGLTGVAARRSSGSSWPRSIMFGLIASFLAALVAYLKNVLLGH